MSSQGGKREREGCGLYKRARRGALGLHAQGHALLPDVTLAAPVTEPDSCDRMRPRALLQVPS